jgi:PAS domain S-box-containing protein
LKNYAPLLKENLVVGIGVVLILLIGFLNVFFYFEHARRYDESIKQAISSIAELKADELGRWHKERKGDAGVLLENTAFAALARQALENPADPKPQKDLRGWLLALQRHYGYQQVIFLDCAGRRIVSNPEDAPPPSPEVRRAAGESLRAGQVMFVDFYRDEACRAIQLAYVVPILDGAAGNSPIGSVALTVDPEQNIYKYLRRWPTPSTTAESLLVRRDGGDALFLNELRFKANSALSFRISLERVQYPAVKAVLGQQGFVDGVDYRDVRIIADIRPIEDTPWFMVTRMDKTEAYGPLKIDMWMKILFSALLVFAGISIGWIFYRQLARARYASEIVKINDALAESEAQFRAVFENAGVGMTIRDIAGRFVRANPAWCQMLGYSNDELKGRSFQEVLHPEDIPASMAMMQRVLSGRSQSEFLDKRYCCKDGRIIWCHTSMTLIRDESGAPLKFVVQAQDITERKRAEAALRESARQKDDFLAMLGHELRNPLAPIRNASQLLKLIGSPDPRAHKAREMIERQTLHLGRIVDDLLDLSRIAHGKIVLQKSQLDWAALARDGVEDYRAEVEARHIHLETNIPDSPVWVMGDATRLSQVLSNLLVNAQKFSDSGGFITVALETPPETGTAVLSVADKGQGISADVMAHLFEPFVQAEMDLSRKRGGLGLALSKGIIELHGGSVQAASDGPGRGARFCITLPLLSPPEQATLLESAAVPAHALRVLVIEDNQDAAESLQLLMELGGHTVATALDGQSGLEKARGFAPDVILCDIGLPGQMDGYAVASQIRADPALSSVFMAAMTGYGQEDDKRRALAAGFNLHVTKPADPAILNRILADVAAREKMPL